MYCYQSPELGELAKALASAQGELEAAKKTKEGQAGASRKYKYATLEDSWQACRKVLPKHGLSIIQYGMQQARENVVPLCTRLLHSSGQWIEGVFEMPLPQYTPQGFGSALTYARRYSLNCMVGLTTDEDDDAQAAMPTSSYQMKPPPPAPTPPAAMDPGNKGDQPGEDWQIDQKKALVTKFRAAMTRAGITEKQLSLIGWKRVSIGLSLDELDDYLQKLDELVSRMKAGNLTDHETWALTNP